MIGSVVASIGPVQDDDAATHTALTSSQLSDMLSSAPDAAPIWVRVGDALVAVNRADASSRPDGSVVLLVDLVGVEEVE